MNEWYARLKRQAIALTKNRNARTTDISQELQAQVCPRNARLEWTTAKVKSNREKSVMDFDIRCIECAKEYMLYELLQSQGILANSDDEGTMCIHDSCSSPRLHCAIFCAVHILSHTVNTGPCRMDHQTLISQQLEVNPIWKVDRNSNFGFFLNRRQLTGAPAFFSLDLEVISLETRL